MAMYGASGQLSLESYVKPILGNHFNFSGYKIPIRYSVSSRGHALLENISNSPRMDKHG